MRTKKDARFSVFLDRLSEQKPISRLPPLDSGPANVILDVTTTIERQTRQKNNQPTKPRKTANKEATTHEKIE